MSTALSSASTTSVASRLIDWPAAHAAVRARAVADEAERLGVQINVAVVEGGELLTASVRMAGAPLHPIDIDKAYTAASFGLPAGRGTDALQSQSDAVRRGLVQRPRFVAFGGGVSGGSERQGERCAQAALRALGLDAV